MQEEHQPLLPPNSPISMKTQTQTPTPTTKSTSYSAVKQEKKPRKETNKVLNKWRTLINFGLVLLVLANSLLLLFIVISFMQNSLNPAVNWGMTNPGRTFEMDDADFLVSSTSETCNELVRDHMLVNNQNLGALDYSYIFMVLCLDVAEPHRSSQSGNNFLLKANAVAGTCSSILGFGSFPNLTIFRPFIEVHKEAEYLGSMSIWDPAAFRVVEDFIYDHGAEGILIVRQILKELSMMRFPMTKQLYSVITQNTIESMLLFHPAKSFAYLFRENVDKSLTPEGELMGRQPSSLVLDRSAAMALDRVKRFGNSGTKKEERTKFPKNYAITKALNKTMTEYKMVKIPHTDYKICASQEAPGLQKRTIASLLVEYAKSPVASKSTMSPLQDIEIYKKMYGLLEKNFPDTKMTLKAKDKLYNSTEYSTEVGKLNKMSKESRKNNGLQYEANSFVILDRQQQIAIAYISSLGTAFASFMSLFGPSDIANNMMYKFAQFWEEDAIYQHLMDPMIITKGKKIHIAYAGQGARFRRSLDVVRRFFSLIFTLFHNVQLDLALTTPLIYPLSGTTPNSKNAKTSEHTNGFPWVHVNEIQRQFRTTVVSVPNLAADIVTAIYGNAAIFLDGNHGVEIQPTGI